ncbi:MAG: pyridoxamine 5'-phosphate oxidase [Chloroflexi bacterium]|nr:pyridoxamine 5'-phosphate oxidase [Chloroflexota bacterium]MCI0577248.1 pyridoxamine 5'-phosphate oxidase [Chloroflexota bacterium]MCI0646729.1 pyridoxamine 5'-phosphate oxidase [Chloroflexota bacterium]MCI0731363.1 pyridoxamine 5'-phosphate oxidase [Chloroflexota bacterium]
MSLQETPPLKRSSLNPDPFRQFADWFEAVMAASIENGHAMTLATATSDGRPSARMVLLKEYDERGFVFFSNYDSQKGQELAENPQAALVFYWVQFHRQIRITGQISRVSAAESDNYFHSRPRGSQLSAAASPQSRVVPGRATLEEQVAWLAERYEGQEVPRPAQWGGYRLAPDSFEFWQGRPDRLHDRFRYTRRPEGGWIIERLAP